MTFIHEHPEFKDLLDIVAAEGPLASAAMVEKDYWICHTLWALERSGLHFWFKGGTSLSKAFGIIQRFSEDLDLIIENGQLTLPNVTSWRTETKGATRSREEFWQALLDQIDVPGAQLEWNRQHDPSQRNPGFQLHYPGHLTEQLRNPDSIIKPFVLLEISHGSVARSAREPSITRPISSAVHDRLAREGQLDAFVDNRPAAVECVHPYVTLLEKLDAITRRYARPDDVFDPATFVRHYEDAAMIIRSENELPPLEIRVLELAHLMQERGQIRRLVTPAEDAFTLEDDARRRRIEQSYELIRPMYWGDRIPLDEATATIINWLEENGF